MMKSEELRAIMAQCYGTEKWYRLFPTCNFLYTDGVKTFAENAEAYWLITEVFALVDGLPDDLYEIKLTVKDMEGVITIQTGKKVVRRREINFTDCPEGKWVFFYCDHVFLWHDEY